MHDMFQFISNELRGSWRFRWSAIITAWTVCVFGWLFVFSMPDIYEARAQVFVDADSRLADVMGQVGVDPGVGSRVFVVRQAMLGLPQLDRVATETGIDKRATNSEEREELLLSLQDRLSVNSGRSNQSRNLYTLAFQDTDRDMAVLVVQTLLDSFVEDVLNLREVGTEEVTGYLEDQLNYYSGLLSESETALADFKKRHVGLLPGESGGIFERLQREMDVLSQLRSELLIQEDRRDELRRQLASETPYVAEETSLAGGAVINGSPTQMTITELESRKGELLLSMTERHPDVVAVNEQLEQLYEKREAERTALASSSGGIEGAQNANNPVYQSVQIALNDAGVRIAGLRSQVSQGDVLVRRLNRQINTIPEIEAEFSELTRNYAQYGSLYNELLETKERERMGTVGEDRDVVSFNITEPPAASFDPVAPRRVLLLIGILILGLGTGGGVAFIIHQLNPIFQDARTLRDVTGVPVLGVVSRTWLERHRIGRRIDISSFAVAAASLVAVFVVSVLLNEQIVGIVQSFFL